jgi:hypothetical protein
MGICVPFTLTRFSTLTFRLQMPTPLRVSRLGGRGAYRAEESPGSTETRCRLTAGGGDPRESATEKRPPPPHPPPLAGEE